VEHREAVTGKHVPRRISAAVMDPDIAAVIGRLRLIRLKSSNVKFLQATIRMQASQTSPE